MPRFNDIPAFQPPNYSVHVAWTHLKFTLDGYQRDYGLDWEPEFQRGYVWTLQQQAAYIEFCLLGGVSGRDIYLNAPYWPGPKTHGPIQIVDGKQRLTAVLDFLNNKVPIFGGSVYADFEDELSIIRHRFTFNINDLTNPVDVIRWYLALNTGGTIHTPEEIERVRQLLKKHEVG